MVILTKDFAECVELWKRRWENCVRSQHAYIEGDCFLYLVVSSRYLSFYITWLGTIWRDLMLAHELTVADGKDPCKNLFTRFHSVPLFLNCLARICLPLFQGPVNCLFPLGNPKPHPPLPHVSPLYKIMYMCVCVITYIYTHTDIYILHFASLCFYVYVNFLCTCIQFDFFLLICLI